jgi:hypothetical protein
MTGYWLSKLNQCVPCPSYCYSCTNGSACEQLITTIGQVLVVVNNMTVLAACDVGCLKCSSSSPGSCALCYPGYILSPPSDNILTYCLPCAANCMSCTSSVNLATCTACYPGNFLSSGACQSCDPSCLTCTLACTSCTIQSATYCTSCPVNSVLFNNGTCSNVASVVNCGTGCASCIQDSVGNFACTICSPGFMVFSGYCIPCPSGCAQCSSANFGNCISCLTGYYFNLLTSSCMSCGVANCNTCNSLGCTSCVSGFMLNSISFTCQLQCATPCATCSANDPTSCLTCIAGYVPNPSNLQNCQPDISCNSNSSCTVCPFGFALQAGLN